MPSRITLQNRLCSIMETFHKGPQIKPMNGIYDALTYPLQTVQGLPFKDADT